MYFLFGGRRRSQLKAFSHSDFRKVLFRPCYASDVAKRCQAILEKNTHSRWNEEKINIKEYRDLESHVII